MNPLMEAFLENVDSYLSIHGVSGEDSGIAAVISPSLSGMEQLTSKERESVKIHHESSTTLAFVCSVISQVYCYTDITSNLDPSAVTLPMKVNADGSTDSTSLWRLKATGALLLQIHRDPTLLADYTKAHVIVFDMGQVLPLHRHCLTGQDVVLQRGAFILVQLSICSQQHADNKSHMTPCTLLALHIPEEAALNEYLQQLTQFKDRIDLQLRRDAEETKLLRKAERQERLGKRDRLVQNKLTAISRPNSLRRLFTINKPEQ